jgi:chromosome segregation ATPase
LENELENLQILFESEKTEKQSKVLKIEELQKNLELAEEMIENLNQETLNLRQKIMASEESGTQKTNEITEKLAEIFHLKSAVTGQKDKNQGKKLIIQEKNKKLEDMQVNHFQLQSNLRDLSHQLKSTQAELESLNQSDKEKQRKINQLDKALLEKTIQLEESSEKLRDYQSKLLKESQDSKNLQKKSLDQSNQIENLSIQAKSLEHQILQKDSLLKDSLTKNSESLVESERYKKALQESKQNLLKLEEIIQSQNLNFELLAKSKKVTESELSESRTQVKFLEANHQRTSDTLAQYQLKVKDLNSYIKEQEKNIEALYQKLQKSIDDHDANMHSLNQSKIAALKEARSRFDKEKEIKLEKIQKLENFCQELKKENLEKVQKLEDFALDLKSENLEKLEKIQKLEEFCRELSNENIEKLEKIQKLEEFCRELNNENSEKLEKIQKLEDFCRELSNENADKDEKISDLVNELKFYKEKITSSLLEHQKFEDLQSREIFLTEEELKVLRMKHNDLAAFHESVIRMNEELKSSKRDLLFKLRALTDENKTLTDKLEALSQSFKETLNEKDRLVVQMTEDNTQLKSKLANLKDDFNFTKSSLTRDLNETTQQVQVKASEIQRIRQVLDKKQAELNQVSQDLLQKNSAFDEISLQLALLKEKSSKKVEKLSNSLTSTTESLNSHQALTQSLKQSAERLEVDNKSLSSEVEESRALIEKLLKEKNDLEVMLEEFRKILKDSGAFDIKELREMVVQLQTQKILDGFKIEKDEIMIRRLEEGNQQKMNLYKISVLQSDLEKKDIQIEKLQEEHHRVLSSQACALNKVLQGIAEVESISLNMLNKDFNPALFKDPVKKILKIIEIARNS